MFNSGILDVAIGIVFIYLLFALACTAINELVEAKLKRRAAELERGIRELLQDHQGIGIVAQLYRHPLIAGLYPGQYMQGAINARTGRHRASNLPSYIPSRNFALALMDIVLPGGTAQPSGASGAVGSRSARPVMRNPLAPLRQAIPSLAHPELERALTALVDAAGNDIAKARENIEAWYDSSMDRVSGWYKRHVQFMTFVVALGLVFVCNVDTLTITRALAQDAVLRARIVADAEAYTKANLPSTPAADASSKKDEAPSGAKPLPKDADQAGAPPAAAIEGAPADAKKGSSAKNDAKSPEDKLDGVSQEIRKLGLPLGWGTDDPRTALPTGLSAFLYKIFGLLLTAIAVSLGAPFWFDMLNRIMVVRATVKPREKSPDEPAVDR